MSRGIKILWIVIGCIFAAGVVLTAAGLALGGTGGAYLDRNGIHFGQRTAQTVEYSDADTEEFEDIDIKLLQADVEIVEADSYGYNFMYTGTQEPRIEVKDGKLKIVEDSENWGINIFNIWGAISPEAKLTVYVPSKAALDEVNLDVVSGNTTLQTNHLRIEDLVCQSASGNVKLSGMELEELLLNVASGDVTLDDLTVSSTVIDMASGKLTCNKVVTENLDINIASGDINYAGEVNTNLVLRMVSGDADFELAGSEEDYTFDFERLSGDIRVSGKDVGSSYQPGGSGGDKKTSVAADITSGSVNFTFTG